MARNLNGVLCELPWPPSANHAWRPTKSGGKILSEDHRAFRRAVNGHVLEHHIPRHWTVERLIVGILCFPPDRGVHDLDNRVKTTLDALQHAGVISNDSTIDALIVQRAQVIKAGAVVVRIDEIARVDRTTDWRNWIWHGSAIDVPEVHLQPFRTLQEML